MDFAVLGAFVFGILGILITIVAMILVIRKSGSERQPKEKDESE